MCCKAAGCSIFLIRPTYQRLVRERLLSARNTAAAASLTDHTGCNTPVECALSGSVFLHYACCPGAALERSLPDSTVFCPAIFYFSHHTRYRTGIVFAFVNVTLIFFWILAAFAVPMQAVRTLTYLLLGIDLFFLISFSVRTEQELLLLLQVFYFLFCGLCAVAMVQSCVFKVSPSGTMQDSAAFGEIMVLLFPFSMVYPSALKSRKRRALYFAALMIPAYLQSVPPAPVPR